MVALPESEAWIYRPEVRYWRQNNPDVGRFPDACRLNALLLDDKSLDPLETFQDRIHLLTEHSLLRRHSIISIDVIARLSLVDSDYMHSVGALGTDAGAWFASFKRPPILGDRRWPACTTASL